MARSRFSPPQVASPAPQSDVLRAPKPPRYAPWSVGQPPPAPAANSEVEVQQPPPGPTPQVVEIPVELVEQAFDQARAQGFEAGVEEGRAAGQAETEAERQRLSESVEALLETQQRLVEHYRQEALQVALAVGEAIARIDLSQRADQIRAVITEMLVDFSDASAFELRMSAHDHERLEPWLEQLHAQHERLRVAVDPSFEVGDAKIASPNLVSHSRLEDRVGLARQLLGGNDDEVSPD